MIPFPGESVGCPDAWSSDARAFFLSNDIELRYKRTNVNGDGHYQIDAGEQWRCWAYCISDWAYLEAGDTTPLTVSWVIEVLGGVGTLALRDGHDADWDYDHTTPLPNDLGIITVAIPGTYVVTTTTFPDNDDLVAILNGGTGPANLSIVCTGGSVDIQQVKLRVWPTTGPLGGWSIETATEVGQNIFPSVWRQAVQVLSPPEGFASQAEFRDAFVAGTVSGAAEVVFSGDYMNSASMTAQHTEYDPEVSSNIHDYSGLPGFGYVRLVAGRLQGPAEADWLRPPEEVQDEADSVIFQTTGPGTVSWLQGRLSWLIGSSTSDGTTWWFADGSFYASVEPVAAFLPTGASIASHVGSGTPVGSFDSPGAATGTGFVQSFNLPVPTAGQLYLLTFWHEGYLGDIDEVWDGAMAGGSSNVQVFRGRWDDYPGGALALLRATWTPDAYRYWDPFGGVPEPEPSIVPAGYFLLNPSNLGGIPDGVEVNFS